MANVPELNAFRVPPTMKTVGRAFAGLFVLLILASGCTVTSSSVTPNTNLKTFKTFYVIRNPGNTLGLDKIIESELIKLGLNASSGPESSRPKEVAVIVTYDGQWLVPEWPMADLIYKLSKFNPDFLYLRTLVIQLHHPENNVLLASGQAENWSQFAGAASMAKAILEPMFKGAPAAP